MWSRVRRWFSPDLAIDLGTATTLVGLPDEGVVLEEPSVVALERGTRRVLGRGAAVGRLAKQMLGRTPDTITAVQPIRHGVVTDFELCEAMLAYFLRKAGRMTPGVRPRVVMTVPSGLTAVERRAVFNSAERAGAGRVYLLDGVRAVALGAGLPISEPLAQMICVMGSGSTEVAVLSLGAVVASRSIRVAGDQFDTAIVRYLKQHFALRIGEQSAEQLKRSIGSASPLDDEQTAEVRGLDLISGIPRRAVVTSEQARQALAGPLSEVLDAAKAVIEQIPPEMVADLTETGMLLAGGAAQLPGLCALFEEQLGIPCRLAKSPAYTVIHGALVCVEHLTAWQHVLHASDARA